ncbi:MAG: hypothetical protein IJL23_02025, partial [Alphaproteobacteria bacterium]|nr:hypothetical protein [Alphaproteobacteria bacterium]
MFRFLLRFFAVFIACSVFVGLASRPVFAAVGTDTCNDNNGTCGTIGLDSSASCNNPPLLWHGESNNYGTYTLTAQYDPNRYRITYVTCANGTGENKSYSGDATYGLVFGHQWTTQTFAGAGFSANAGWHFVGWNTMQDGTGVSYEEGTLQSAWNQTNDLTLYAICEENDRYTVTYKAGTCGKDGLASDIVYTDSVAAGVSYTASQDAQTAMESAQNPVYTFVGWNTNSGQTTSNWSGETISGNVIVYAACTPKDYTVTYKGGTCEEESQITENVNGGASYSVQDLTELSGFSAPSNTINTIFAGWQVCWESETSSGCANMSPASFNAPKDNSWTFAWKNDANLTLTGICNPSCAGNQDYPILDSNNKSCYKIETVYCTPVPGTVPDNCLDTEENPAEWSESCTCNGVNSISYRVYENGTIAQEDGGDIPDQVAPTLTCSELLSATGAPGYNDYDPDLKQCPEIDTFELTFNCNDGHTGLDESDRQAGSLITIAQEAPTCYLDVKNWTCEPENSLVEATYSEGAITSFKMPNTNVICTANYEYKVDYYCSETTNVSKKQDTVMHGENYTWWNEPTSNTCSEAATKSFNGWSCEPGGTRSAGAQGTYEWYQDMRCNASWTQKFPVYYDCNNNGLGTDGNGTNPSDSNSPYAAGATVNVLAYPAGCQAPTERVADATLGWECVAQDGTQVYSGSGNADFNMPAQSVTCTAKWKSTAWSITYMGCNCDTSSYSDLFYNKCTQDLTSRVRSGEYETNDSSTYYRTFTATRPVTFPTVAGNTNYGEINVASTAFGG